jgi:predicted nucleic acid-binding Zn finger protein
MILPSIGNTCLERSSQFFLLVIHLKIAFITEFDKNNKAIINETLKVLSKKMFNSIGISINFIHKYTAIRYFAIFINFIRNSLNIIVYLFCSFCFLIVNIISRYLSSIQIIQIIVKIAINAFKYDKIVLKYII